ncbi:MAG: hypothetical protein FJ206_14310 [Gemmatimonadetes bacterium]|nr:hypothetical protein [Gemmatimonadota bacterium]
MLTADHLIAFAAGLAAGLVALVYWRLTAVRAIRRDAVRRSAAVIAGRVSEQLVPYLPGFEFNPKDVRFLGSPVDLVVFDGLSTGTVARVVFLEIKTGGAGLSSREKEVRDAIHHRRVEWRELYLGPQSMERPK